MARKNWVNCIYEYDGTYDGMLCCVFDSYTRKENPLVIRHGLQAQMALEPVHCVPAVRENAMRIERSVRSRSMLAAELMQRGYLTCLENRELIIYRMICRLYEEGAAFLKNPADDSVYPLHTAIRAMFAELEHLRGFVRFSEYNGVYAAQIAPKNRVLPALYKHFCSRFADQPFLIYDSTHHEALFYAKRHWQILPVDSYIPGTPTERELTCRRLWKRFFDSIAITERVNPSLQRSNLPLRYRADMTEFQDEAYFVDARSNG